MELTNDGNKGILYKGVLYEGYDPRYLPTAYLHCDNWPDPLPNLNLTVTEKDIWYEGQRITFTTWEECLEKKKAVHIPTYDELVRKIIDA